jgi:hypothetical protein
VYRVLGRRLFAAIVFGLLTLNKPARIVNPHGNHAHETAGEVRGEFQPRRVRAFAALETTPRRVKVGVVFSRD